MQPVRRRLTYSNVVSTLALFLVLAGGTAFAAKHLLPKNSVGTKQIRNGAVTGAKIKKGTVTAAALAPGTIPGASGAPASSPAPAATVPNAVNADHATSAISAESAVTLQGQTPAQIAATSKLRCGIGTTAVGSLCFDSAPRAAATYLNALRTCAEARMQLPTDGELALLMVQAGIHLKFAWAAGHFYNKGNLEAPLLTVEEDGSVAVGAEFLTGKYIFWCVATPGN